MYVGFHSTNNLDDGYLGSGKLIKRAINKYGPENFSRETLAVFDNKKDAEELEREIVNEEFTLRDDTYNVALGGNVRIMCKENNPWFGKSHDQETIFKMQENRTRTINERGYVRTTPTYYWFSFQNSISYSQVDAKKLLVGRGCTVSMLIRKIFLNLEDIEFVLPNSKEYFIKEHEKIVEKRLVLSQKIGDTARKRFGGVPKSEEQKRKMGESNSKVDHVWQDKINKNPDKIAKTAEKHIGMKRSADTKENLSIANKARIEFKRISNGGKMGIAATPHGVFSSLENMQFENKQNALNLCFFGMNNRIVTESMYKKYKPLITKADIGNSFKQIGWDYKENEQ